VRQNGGAAAARGALRLRRGGAAEAMDQQPASASKLKAEPAQARGGPAAPSFIDDAMQASCIAMSGLRFDLITLPTCVNQSHVYTAAGNRGSGKA